jgi:hypothetical protein
MSKARADANPVASPKKHHLQRPDALRTGLDRGGALGTGEQSANITDEIEFTASPRSIHVEGREASELRSEILHVEGLLHSEIEPRETSIEWAPEARHGRLRQA